MINFSYGHISKEYLNLDYIKGVVKDSLEFVDFSNYSIPGGANSLRLSMVSQYTNGLCLDNCCTSVSTNLSFFILSKILGGKLGFVYPIYSNFYSQINVAETEGIQILFDDFVSGKVNYSKLENGKLAIVYPSNPTGSVCDLSVLEKKLQIMNEYNIKCIIDISWINSIYDASKVVDIRIISEFVAKYNAILLLGFTKLFAVPSIRCSGVIANKNIIASFIKHHDMLALSCGQIDEFMVEKFMEQTPVNWAQLKVDLYKKAKIVENKIKLSGLNLDYIFPDAGIFFYLYINEKLDLGEVIDKCKKRGLLIYSSKYFEDVKKGFRISFCHSPEILEEGVNILLDTLGELEEKDFSKLR